MVNRKIPIEKIEHISLSNESAEFILHVPQEYDYRFSQPELSMKNQIISAIVERHLKMTGKQNWGTQVYDVHAHGI